MPLYVYKAKKDASATITGEVNAQNSDEAVELIAQMGLIAVSIEEKTSHGVLVKDIRAKKIHSKDILHFSKQLSSLIKSGVGLLKALELISVQTSNVYFAKIITDIASGVKGGRSFSVCLSDYPDVFNPLYISMVRAGEEMGQLRDVLEQLTQYQMRQQEVIAKLKGASIYPALMLFLGIATTIFILTFVLPKMAGIFQDTGTLLPLPTRIVLFVSNGLKIYGIPLLVGVMVSIAGIWRWSRTIQGQWTLSRILLTLPFIKHLVIKISLARFCRTMNLLLNSGLPLVRALDVAIDTVTNLHLKSDLSNSITDLTAGESLSASFSKSSLLPTVMVQVVAVAEESGALTEALGDLALTYEEELEQAAKAITTLIEPVLILSIGSVIAFIVFAMLLPIFSMDIMAR